MGLVVEALMPGASLAMQTPEPLLRALSGCGLGGRWIGREAAPELPTAGGAYLLLLGVARAVPLELPRLGCAEISPGWYLYAGCAHGPGGLRARIARHLRPEKRAHWHIDRLTRGASASALAVPGTCECDLIEELLGSGAFDILVPGFGSSDCRRCRSHLVIWTPGAGS